MSATERAALVESFGRRDLDPPPTLTPAVIDVLNLATGRSVLYLRLPDFGPAAAVVAAHAQSLRDWNTWDYADRYGGLVERGRGVVACGDWCAIDPLGDLR